MVNVITNISLYITYLPVVKGNYDSVHVVSFDATGILTF